MKQLQEGFLVLQIISLTHTHTFLRGWASGGGGVWGGGLWGSGRSGRHLGVGPVDCLEWPLRSGSAAALHKTNCGWHRLHLCSFSPVRCFITTAGSLWMCVSSQEGQFVLLLSVSCVFLLRNLQHSAAIVWFQYSVALFVEQIKFRAALLFLTVPDESWQLWVERAEISVYTIQTATVLMSRKNVHRYRPAAANFRDFRAFAANTDVPARPWTDCVSMCESD